MTSLREFFSLPFGSRGAGEDTPVGVDELGRTVYEDARGQRYVMTEAAPITPGDIRGAIAGGAQAFADDPVGAGGNALAALAAAAWNGIEAPANALRGEYMTYGDVADTALDWGVLGAAGSAPEGALRASWGRVDPRPGQGFDDWLDELYAPEARAARASGELPPVVQPNTYYRGVSPQEMAQAEAQGFFDANGAGVFVANDPTRYTGGGAYGARRGGSIVQFDTRGMETIPMRGGLGTGDDFGFQSVPIERMERVWDWDAETGQHILRADLNALRAYIEGY